MLVDNIMKNYLIIIGGIILFWFLFGGVFAPHGDPCAGMTDKECEAVSDVMGSIDRAY